jgi:hypothetical protein
MKLCIEGDIYFIPKFHILETGTVKLSIETDLIIYDLIGLRPISMHISVGYHAYLIA